MSMLKFITAINAGFFTLAAHATDWGPFYVTPQTPTFMAGSLPAAYSDTLTFQIPTQVVFPADTFLYDNNITITIEGAVYRQFCVRCVNPLSVTTMPKTDNIQLLDASGNQALDINGAPVKLTYLAAQSAFGPIDRWMAQNAKLAAGVYVVSGIAGISCAEVGANGVCNSPGGTYWKAVFGGTWTIVYSPPPCNECDRTSQ